MKSIYRLAAAAALGFLVAACTEGDKFEPGMETILFTGTEQAQVVRVNSAAIDLTVSATGKASEDVTVRFRYDAAAVDRYNAENKTSYRALPEEDIYITDYEVVIPSGSATSNVSQVFITDDSYAGDGYIYVIPLVITDVEGGSYKMLESSDYILIRPTAEYRFPAFDVNNPNLSAYFIFPDEQHLDLPTYTYEIKFYAYSFKGTGTDAISRLCQWSGKEGEASNMLRFGENGYEGNSLQLVSPAGNIVSNTLFQPERWYMLSLVYDGSTMTMYVDGEPEEQKANGDGATEFQRFEMGMSWQSYNYAQLFSGRIAEMRIWNRALSVTEMKEGLCNVPVDAEGLCAYWKFDEGEGHVFHDATGNGFDMDWSDTWRDDGTGLKQFDKSSYADGQWIEDDNNVCRN